MNPHQWSNLHIDVIADVLNGCKWSCSGCGVPKSRERLPSREEVVLMEELLGEFLDAGFTLDHFELGPTDFAVSGNFQELTERPDIVRMVSRFQTPILISTLLELEERILRQLEVFQRSQFNVYLVIDSLQISRERYLEHIQKNLEILRNHLAVGKVEVFFNTVEQSRESFERSVLETKKAFGVLPWHVVSSSRAEDLHSQRQKILTDIERLNEVFNASMKDDDVKVNFQYASEIRPTNRAYVWSQGEWYWPPVLYGHFVNHDRKFLMPKPSTLSRFQSFEKDKIVSQYQGVDGKDCFDCSHQAQCINQGVLSLMDVLDRKKCIAPRSAFDVFRGGL